jgi:hypothetical protein
MGYNLLDICDIGIITCGRMSNNSHFNLPHQSYLSSLGICDKTFCLVHLLAR